MTIYSTCHVHDIAHDIGVALRDAITAKQQASIERSEQSSRAHVTSQPTPQQTDSSAQRSVAQTDETSSATPQQQEPKQQASSTKSSIEHVTSKPIPQQQHSSTQRSVEQTDETSSATARQHDISEQSFSDPNCKLYTITYSNMITIVQYEQSATCLYFMYASIIRWQH